MVKQTRLTPIMRALRWLRCAWGCGWRSPGPSLPGMPVRANSGAPMSRLTGRAITGPSTATPRKITRRRRTAGRRGPTG